MRPRIRTIKPDVFHDEKLWALYVDTGMPILQGFEGLWCYADREGRFEWRPAALKSLILPYWSGDFELMLEALASKRFIIRYEVDGQSYAWIRKFKEHQKINAREPASTLPPPPPESTRTCMHVQSDAPHGSAPGEGNGNGNGNGVVARECAPDQPSPSSQIPDEPTGTRKPTFTDLEGYVPNEEDFAAAFANGLSREAFLRRLNEARNTPIGGAKGVFSRQKHVRDVLIPKWKTWEEQARFEAARRKRDPPSPPKGRPAAEVMREMREYENAEWERRHAAAQAAKAAKAAQAK